MHQDRMKVSGIDISGIVRNINDLMCCANCKYGDVKLGKLKCSHSNNPKTLNGYCDNWMWDKLKQEDRIEIS